MAGVHGEKLVCQLPHPVNRVTILAQDARSACKFRGTAVSNWIADAEQQIDEFVPPFSRHEFDQLVMNG